MGPLRISGTTSRLDCSRQLRRCLAQLGPTIGVVKPRGGMNTWQRPLLPSGKRSRPGRLVKALGHQTMQPNKMPDMQCTMIIKKLTRRSTRILTPSLQKSTTLLTSLEERTLMLSVINQWRMVSIDDSQFGFVPGRGITDAIFVVRQLQEKYLAANKRLYMAFIDLEKAFDRVPRKVIWWALRKLGVEEWIVWLVQGMYANARSRVRVGEGYSEEFEMVGVHQGSVLSPLLFIIVLQTLSREFCSGVPWEDLYARGMCQEALDLERSNGEERTESKCR